MPKNIINMPRMNSSEFEETNNYLELCDKLGSFISQATSSPIKKLEITYKGEIAKLQNRELFTRTILQGILNPITETAVNAVNATSVAKARGIRITEAVSDAAEGYETMIKVTAKTKSGTMSADGTYLHEPKIIKVNGYWVDVKPEGNMFIAKYKDIPGSIGAIGTKFGEQNINIGIMQVGRDSTGGEAVMILTLDEPATKKAVEEIKSLENVYDATSLSL